MLDTTLDVLPSVSASLTPLHDSTSPTSPTSCEHYSLQIISWCSYLSRFAFASVTTDGAIAFDNAAHGDHLKELLTKAASSTTVSVAVSGWKLSEGSTKDGFSVMISSSANRAKFISSVKAFISSYKIDGIEIAFGKVFQLLSARYSLKVF